MALVKSQLNWLKWLDSDVDFVRVLYFDFRKALDTVPRDILSDKPQATGINLSVINWIILDSLSHRKQNVTGNRIGGIERELADISQGIPQGAFLGPTLFSLMVNDIQFADLGRNLMVKFAVDITISIPVRKDSIDSTIDEVSSRKL